MKVSHSKSGCPVGARAWCIHILLCFCITKIDLSYHVKGEKSSVSGESRRFAAQKDVPVSFTKKNGCTHPFSTAFSSNYL